jgi:hypothetical protein
MDDRKYGFKHIKQQYRWMSPGWIEKIVGIEQDKDVVMYFSSILQDLTIPEVSRLESSTDNFDSIEEYVCNRLIFYNIPFESDKVYVYLLASKAFFVQHEAYELCYNIDRAIEIIKEMESNVKNAPIECDGNGLPF